MSLSGRHLLVAAEYWLPWVGFCDGCDEPIGTAYETFKTIAFVLNFTYTIVRPADSTWGTIFPNGSATGMVGMVNRKEVDMAIGPFIRTYQRSELVDFSTPIYIDFFGIFLPRPKLEKDLTNFLRPFSVQVWSGILACTIFGTLLGIGLQRFSVSNKLTEKVVENKKNVAFYSPSWIFRTLSSDYITVYPSLDSGKLFLGTWLLVSLFLTTAYSGVLTSLLAVPKVDVPVNSLKDLVEYGKIPWAFEYGTAPYQLFQEARKGTNEINRIIGEKMLAVKDCYRDRERIVQDGIAIICDSLGMRQVMEEEFSANGTCSYYIAKEPIYTVSLSFIFPKKSSLQFTFNHWLQVLIESGTIEKKILERTANATVCLRKPGSEEQQIVVFTIQDLGGIFLVLTAGSALALLVLVAERLLPKTRGSVFCFSRLSQGINEQNNNEVFQSL